MGVQERCLRSAARTSVPSRFRKLADPRRAMTTALRSHIISKDDLRGLQSPTSTIPQFPPFRSCGSAVVRLQALCTVYNNDSKLSDGDIT